MVNERDGLGDETPPDYLTSVRDGGFYGWPYCYWGQTVDDRVPQDPAAVATAITPDYALGGHTASLGLCWLPAATLPGFPEEGMAIGQHGSWNRSKPSGYRVVFVPFANGRPSGPPRDILTGFLAPDERRPYGRPLGVALGADGSLLVADDVGDDLARPALNALLEIGRPAIRPAPARGSRGCGELLHFARVAFAWRHRGGLSAPTTATFRPPRTHLAELGKLAAPLAASTTASYLECSPPRARLRCCSERLQDAIAHAGLGGDDG